MAPDSADVPGGASGLARLMHRFQPWLDAQRWEAAPLVVHGGSVGAGSAYVTIAPQSVARAASFNENRIYLCGTDGGLDRAGVRRLLQLFEDRGIARFFVWTRPGQGSAELTAWLQQSGLRPVPWTRYPTMVHASQPQVTAGTGLQIRAADAAEVHAARGALGEALSDDALHAAGREGVHHFLAWAGSRPVAVAALLVFEELGYLTFAGTVPEFRSRGAQQALIARRLDLARQLGCRTVVAETLTMLPHSMSNLQRLGFVVAHEREVYASGD